MKGNIFFLRSWGGEITKETGGVVKFDKSGLKNCTIRQLEEGDYVEFDILEVAHRRPLAYNIRKLTQVSNEVEQVNPGINPDCDFSHYYEDEMKIIKTLSKVFYITSGGSAFDLGRSHFDYCLIKPTSYFTTTFQLIRELPVVFSDYVSFEPRSLDAASKVPSLIQSKLRLERGCHVFISRDANVEEKLVKYLKDSNFNQIVIPFTYDELMNEANPEIFIRNRFKKYLFDTDLFAAFAPIKDDVFFFGRRDFAHDIASKCKKNIHCGVFGLRRSGKTSLLYAVQNILNQQSYKTVFIPCESDLLSLNWRAALCRVVKNVYQVFEMDTSDIVEEDYMSEYTSSYFEDDLYKCLKDEKNPVTIMFDEIEAITFGVAQGEESDNKWCDGNNFMYFWNTIKGYYSKHPNQLSILVAGTNPMINEVPVIGSSISNPMYRQLSESNQGAYLRSFTVEDTKIMVNTLGGYMGISFDDYSVGELSNDCGGHPYLMRLLCSHINKYVREANIPRPVVITKAIYDKALPEFEKSNEATGFFLMILNILMVNYPKEYNVLKILAIQGDKYVSQTQDKDSLLHLIGYGLIDVNHDNYAIRYSIITRFLRNEYRFERTDLSIEEQKEEIHHRINKSEMALRKLVRNTLATQCGKKKGKEIVLEAMEEHSSISFSDRRKAEAMEFQNLFDTSQNKMFLSLLRIIIVKNFNFFKIIFSPHDAGFVEKQLETINKARRCPDHSYSEDAKNWSQKNFEDFRESMSWLEQILDDYD